MEKFHSYPAIRRAMLVSAAVLSLGSTGDAFAQDATAAEDDNVIVVTAQRRAENIQDVPISITALSAEALERSGIEDSRDLPIITPGLRMDSVGAFVQPAIRGITTTLTSGPEANVATYLDGVYRPNTEAAIYELPDVKQIEVLKGPQGTLFGRNATGGAILITTAGPDLTTSTGKISAGYSSFDSINVSGFVSVPLAQEKLALSVSGLYDNVGDGWKTNLVTGSKKGSGIETGLVRGKLRFAPWEGADFTLNGLYSWRNDNSAYRNTIWMGNSDFAGVPGVIIPIKPWTYANDIVSEQKNRAFDLSLRGDIEIGRGTLTTTTAYSHSKTALRFDSDNVANGGSFATTDTNYTSYTQELVYATDQLGDFRAVGGLFFFQSEYNTEPYFVPGFNFQLYFRDKAKSYAGFGEVTYDLNDRVSLTAGLRYSHEKKSGFNAVQFGPPPFATPTLIQVGVKSWDSFTPRLSLLYKATDDTNLYATYSQGFKSGLFNTPSFQTQPVNPETVKSYELGVKSDVSDSLRVNVAAFHYNYKDLQVPSLESVNNVLTQRILNAATAKIWGAELNVDWQVVPDFTIVTGISYLDAKYASFPNASINVPVSQLPAPGNSLCTETPDPTSGLCNISADVSGNRMIRTPEFSGSVSANYKHDFGPGTLSLSGTVYYSSEVFHDFGDRVRQPSYAKLNASAGWRFNNGVSVKVYGRNLTNKAVITSLLSTSSYDAVDYERPREYGVGVSYAF